MSEEIKVAAVASEAGATGLEGGGLAPRPAPAAKWKFLFEYFGEVKRGFAWMRAAPKAEASVFVRTRRGLMAWSRLPKARMGAVAVVVIIGLSYGLFSVQAGSTPLLAAPAGGGGGGGPGANHGAWAINDTVNQNSQKDFNATLNTSIFKSLTVTLTWTDEPSSSLMTNTPDSLGFTLLMPDGNNATAGPAPNPQGGQGKLAWALNSTGRDLGGTEWKFTVVGGNMGDFVRPSGRNCLACPADSSNAFQLRVDYTW
jgi:hypothetical protein